MTKRNAIRIGHNPNSPESIAYTIDRYGPIRPETLSEIVNWLENHKDLYDFKVGYETLLGERAEFNDGGLITENSHPIIVTRMKGSAIEKTLDNEKDAQNTLANIRNKDFPKNKHGQ